MTLDEALASGKPYFGKELEANQGDNHFKHFPAVVRMALATKPPGQPFRLLEVGSWAGASLVAWARAAPPDAQLTATDAWEPYLPAGTKWPHYDVMSQAARSGRIKELFRHNVRASGIDPRRVWVVHGLSRLTLPALPPGYDIVFIDGDHRYSAVRKDIEMAMPLVRDGGILCGDDLDRQLADIDAVEHREIMGVDEEVATTRSGLCYHHGVVQAVAEKFGRVTCFEKRLWVVRKRGDAWEREPVK